MQGRMKRKYDAKLFARYFLTEINQSTNHYRQRKPIKDNTLGLEKSASY